MIQFVPRKSIFYVMTALTLVAAFAGAVLLGGSAARLHAASPKASTNSNPFCSRLGKSIQASQGAQEWCFGPQANGPSSHTASPNNPSFGSNVDAANPREDRTPSGAEIYGQSEVSVAGIGPYVVEAWNDATGFFAPCPSPLNKEELTGYGFSANGGHSFVDEGGLPNANCAKDVLFGDPSVETWKSGGSAYFYISSLYDNPSFTGLSFLAINACKASGTSSTASISCSQPIIAATSTQCVTSGGTSFCSFLDKEFLSIDPARGRLYMSYTEFGFSGNLAAGQIELAVCDIGTPGGGKGAQGGTPGKPICFPGKNGTPASPGSPYFVVAPGPTCENEGAYPAVDVKTGAVYVAYEFNWATNFLTGAPCNGIPTKNVVKYIPFTCLTLPAASCSGPANSNAVNTISMAAAFIPGYNRFPMNDFPRIAVSDKAGTVSIVWNDARRRPYGDILLQSFDLGSLVRVQSSPVRLNSSTSGWHMLPALRNDDSEGNLYVTFYGRASANTAITNVYDAPEIDPRTTSTPSNIVVTTGPSNWNAVSSDIIPNFGDYTDNYIKATASPPFVDDTLYVAWSDGRIGDPQPFERAIPEMG